MMEPINTKGGPPGGHNPPGRARPPRHALVGCGLLGPPLVPIFWYIVHFDLKNKEKAFGMEPRRLEAELGQEHFCPPVERFCRENFPPGGRNHRHHHHQQLSHLGEGNLHHHLQQHHLITNPSSSLVSNLCIQTSDWYLWVASMLITPCS